MEPRCFILLRIKAYDFLRQRKRIEGVLFMIWFEILACAFPVRRVFLAGSTAFLSRLSFVLLALSLVLSGKASAAPVDPTTWPESRKLAQLSPEEVKSLKEDSYLYQPNFFYIEKTQVGAKEDLFLAYSPRGVFTKPWNSLSFERFGNIDPYSHLTFDEKSETVYYIGHVNDKFSMVVNGRLGPFFDYMPLERVMTSNIDEARSPDGKRLIYQGCIAKRPKSHPIFPELKTCSIVVSDASRDSIVPVPKSVKSKSPYLIETGFSQDSKGYYVVLQDRDTYDGKGVEPWYVVVNGIPLEKPYQGECIDKKTLSVQSTQCSETKFINRFCEARNAGGNKVALRGNRNTSISALAKNSDRNDEFLLQNQSVQFSPDGKKMGYLALHGMELWWIVKNVDDSN